MIPAGTHLYYECGCGVQTFTRLTADGAVPDVISCPECGKYARLAGNAWPQVKAGAEVTHEWYLPSRAVRRRTGALREFFAAGGLALRRVDRVQ